MIRRAGGMEQPDRCWIAQRTVITVLRRNLRMYKNQFRGIVQGALRMGK
jgi:hypothetical protein